MIGRDGRVRGGNYSHAYNCMHSRLSCSTELLQMVSDTSEGHQKFVLHPISGVSKVVPSGWDLEASFVDGALEHPVVMGRSFPPSEAVSK